MKKDFRRAVHFDFHTHPGIDDMNNFDVQKFADILQKSHISYVNIFAKCNQGYCYYPTKIGTVYPGLTKDLFGEMIKELHARNIGVSAYFNVGIDVANLLNHKEWVKQDRDIRQKILDELTEDERQTLIKRIEEEPYLKNVLKVEVIEEE